MRTRTNVLARLGGTARACVVASALALVALAGPAAALGPDEILDDPALEERAREVSKGLRCLVCQNQSIDDSDAPLARDLRTLVRERIEAGDTNDEVVSFVVDRYGDFVLLRPPLNAYTIVLWVAPTLVLIAGAAGLVLTLRRRRRIAAGAPTAAGLSAEEEAALARILERERT
ncbi:cytochrome c-type biogenesis protein [Salinarimonas rosea]|uniref:cytochrome c-type biogenesis protein n=1 Tax=Salinarimonas rosea TaxID=552063 RepID=UPI00041D4863|nr:cytochrome c-type biogenesis protein [Salinarimonas rosea]